MRLTRAARRAEATLVDETPDASNPHTDSDPAARVPLGEISTNAAPEPEPIQDETLKMPPKKTKAKGGAKKGAKGKKAKPSAEEQEQQLDAVVLEDERQAAGSPASDAAVDELANAPTPDALPAPVSDQRPASPPSRAVRMTRRQLAKQEEELSRSQRLVATLPSLEPVKEALKAVVDLQQEQAPQLAVEEQVAEDSTEQQPLEDASVENKELIDELREPLADAVVLDETADVEAGASEPPTPQVDVTESEPEPKVLTSEKPCDSELATPARSRTSSRSPSKSPMRLEESIEAIDALEEALENVVPSLNLSADEKSPRKAKFDSPAPTPARATKRSPLAARVSRTPTAPKSLKAGGGGAVAPRASLVRSASTRAPTREARKGSGDVTDYLASKRRPISMQFPTPPPVAKSTRAPTKSSFQLPGEAIAAKLKAQKEERLKREQEGQQRPPSSTFVPPIVKSNKAPTKSTFQLPGEAIAAKLKAQREERLKREAEGGADRPASTTFQPPPPPKSSKPPTVAKFELPGEAVAAKLKAQREERLKREAEAQAEKAKSSTATAAKSSRPRQPTVPNFTLPGEAISAKHKAQREERLKREAEEAAAQAKKNVFKARPAPSMRNGGAAVRPTASSRARESLMIDSSHPNPSLNTKENTNTNNNSTAATTATAAKRNSLSKPLTLNTNSLQPTTTNSSSVSAPPSASANSTSNHSSVILNPPPSSSSSLHPQTTTNTNTQRLKGKEVFNREKFEFLSREQERREKEDAARRARAAAAERGRAASREWAERQRAKMKVGGGVAGEGKGTETGL